MSDKNNSKKPVAPSQGNTSGGHHSSKEQLKRNSDHGNFSDSDQGALTIVQHFSPPSRRDGNGNTDKK